MDKTQKEKIEFTESSTPRETLVYYDVVTKKLTVNLQSIIDLAIKETEERIVEVIEKSRNVDEQLGIGIKEQQTRNQILSDVLVLIRNK